MRQRNISIDILKSFAVLAITNSHMDMLYVKYSGLATGGAIGDALFFFASGFTILLGGGKTFDNFYKRRIKRIYPTVLAWALMDCLLFGHERNMVDTLLHGGGWFVSCIMLYYILFYFVKKYLTAHLKWLLLITLVASMFLYIPFHTGEGFNIYGATKYKWLFFFAFMLQGAMLGSYSQTQKVDATNGWLEALKAFACIGIFYGFCAFKNSEANNWLQVFSLVPLLGTTYYICRWCNTPFAKRLYESRVLGWTIKAIGGLCLEVYLVQSNLFTTSLNSIFPLNIPLVFVAILIAAYILRCLAYIWAQTFKEEDYKWRDVFRILP